MTQPAPSESSGSLLAALHSVYEDVSHVPKTHSPALGYAFASEVDLIENLRPSLVKNQVVAFVADYKLERLDSYVTRSGAVMQHAVVSATVRFAHAPTGEFITVMAMGEGSDSGDKSINKAMTGALKYALRQTFLVATGDDPDAEKPDAPMATTQPRAVAPQQQARPAPSSGNRPVGTIEEVDGQWYIQCEHHGWSKGKHWEANDRGPENVSCTRKMPDNSWCKSRTTFPTGTAPVAQADAPRPSKPAWVKALEAALVATGSSWANVGPAVLPAIAWSDRPLPSTVKELETLLGAVGIDTADTLSIVEFVQQSAAAVGQGTMEGDEW